MGVVVIPIEGKCGSIPDSLPPILDRLKIDPDNFVRFINRTQKSQLPRIHRNRQVDAESGSRLRQIFPEGGELGHPSRRTPANSDTHFVGNFLQESGAFSDCSDGWLRLACLQAIQEFRHATGTAEPDFAGCDINLSLHFPVCQAPIPVWRGYADRKGLLASARLDSKPDLRTAGDLCHRRLCLRGDEQSCAPGFVRTAGCRAGLGRQRSCHALAQAVRRQAAGWQLRRRRESIRGSAERSLFHDRKIPQAAFQHFLVHALSE